MWVDDPAQCALIDNMGLSCGARAFKFSLFIFNLVFLVSFPADACASVIQAGLDMRIRVPRYRHLVDPRQIRSGQHCDSHCQSTRLRKRRRFARTCKHAFDLSVFNIQFVQATKPTAVRQIGYILLVGGIIVIFVAFLGCCGAFKVSYATRDNRELLNTFRNGDLFCVA